MPTETSSFRSTFLGDLMNPDPGDPNEGPGAGPGDDFDRLDPRSFRPSAGGDGAAGGDPSMNGPMARRDELLQARQDLAIDTDSMTRPEFDQESDRLRQVIAGVGGVASLLGALGGSEIAASSGAGVARGARQAGRRARSRFQKRRQAFRERMQAAEEFNRELSLSVNEARVRGAEQAAERQFEEGQQAERREFQRGQASREREFRREMAALEGEQEESLLRLRQRLDQELGPQEKQRLEKELQLLDQKIFSQNALALERLAQAEAAGRGGGGGDGENPYGHLSDNQVQQLLKRSNFMVRTGFPSQVDADTSGTVSPQERSEAVIGGNVPSSADVDRVAERVSQLRAEAKRRGLIESGQGQGGQPAPADSVGRGGVQPRQAGPGGGRGRGGQPRQNRGQGGGGGRGGTNDQQAGPNATVGDTPNAFRRDGLAQELRRIRDEQGMAAAADTLRSMYQSGQLDRSTTNALIDSLQADQ